MSEFPSMDHAAEAPAATATAAAACVHIQRTADRGRIVVASETLQAGSLACTGLAPYAAVVADASLSSACHYCFSPISSQAGGRVYGKRWELIRTMLTRVCTCR